MKTARLEKNRHAVRLHRYPKNRDLPSKIHRAPLHLKM
jgi:hypothetical protein